MDEHDKHDDPAPGVPDPNPLAQALIDNPGLVPHLLNWIEDQTPNPDTSLDNGARLIIWKMGKEYEGQNPPAYLHLMELAQNREPDITRMDVATLRAVLAATYACAIAMSCSDPAHYGVTLPERNLGCILLADEVARLRIRLVELMPPLAPTTTTLQ